MKRFLTLYTILICFAILSKLDQFFINLVYFILILPLVFYDLNKLGLRNYKNGLMVGLLASIFYLPFLWGKLTFSHLLQIPQVFAEEIFFRGYGISVLENHVKNIHVVNLITSALFTIPHIIINPSIISVLVFFPSVVFGYLFIYTRSIVAPVIFHWFSNLFFQEFFYEFLVRTTILSM